MGALGGTGDVEPRILVILPEREFGETSLRECVADLDVAIESRGGALTVTALRRSPADALLALAFCGAGRPESKRAESPVSLDVWGPDAPQQPVYAYHHISTGSPTAHTILDSVFNIFVFRPSPTATMSEHDTALQRDLSIPTTLYQRLKATATRNSAVILRVATAGLLDVRFFAFVRQ